MNNRLMWKVILLAVLIGGAVLKLYPNFVWYSLPIEERQLQSRRQNPMSKKVVPIGLDLQGGIHLVYQMDTTALPDESESTITTAIEQNILVITNRIDALGVANPYVSRQGRDFIVIQLPGIFNSDQAKSLIGKTALLEFRMVVQDDALLDIVEKLKELDIESDKVINGDLPKEVTDLIPNGTALFPSRDGGYLLVKDEPSLTGKYLEEARVNTQSNPMQIGGLAINFELDSEGAKLFRDLTDANVGERLAIILDSTIQSAPVIQSRIPDGSGQITGSFTEEEAKMLSNVLNSGNLQAPMNVVEERTVGPQLGEDSIRAGFKAILIGFVLVIIFMIVFYRISGILSDIALLLNLLFLLALMSWIHVTLTLPGIAGLILSLAMAVDSNVLILERVREEMAKGKQVKFALDEGYEKALSAIIDGNLTTILAAGFLFQFGTGPVRGFGFTLMIGLAISVFTAVFVTRIFYDVWFSIKKPDTLNI